MKKYLLIATACLVVGANASENPFDLAENLESIEQEEASLLSDLKSTQNTPQIKVVKPTIVKPTIVQPTVVKPTVVQPTIVKPTIDKKAKERAEVEAYEKQRAKVLPKETPIVVVPKVVEVKKPEPVKVVEVKKLEPIKSVIVKEVENDFVADINLTREKEEKARLVDLAYAKAVEEMDRPED